MKYYLATTREPLSKGDTVEFRTSNGWLPATVAEVWDPKGGFGYSDMVLLDRGRAYGTAYVAVEKIRRTD